MQHGELDMNSQNNKQLIVAAFEAFASRDPQRIAARFTDDAEWLAPKGNATGLALNFTDHMVGSEEIARFLASEFGKLFCRDVRSEFAGVYADGDTVIVEMRLLATLANGNAYDNDYCFIFELQSGLIRRMREYMDTAKGHRMIFKTDEASAASIPVPAGRAS
jgi:uncharacterized protein